ncbi:Ig-like domain repeat protein [Streptomyces sp. NPDC059567]|uniref:Ig-like domain repeat protein n=1 Tax=Streptomyces sp. NPDC059567 TaxID=3346867 RepID=UPI0036CC677C
MRKRTLSAATALAVLFSSAALVAGTAGSAAAATDKVAPLPVGSVGDMVVDGVHQRLYFGDTYNNRIVVTDFDGVVLTSITGLDYVRDLDLSADSSRLYAALAGADKIVAIDTEQLTVAAEYPTGTGTKPSTVEANEGKLWFGYAENWDSELGSVDLTTETPTVTLALSAGADWSSTPKLFTDPAAPGTLVAIDSNISSGPIVAYDVTSGTPTVRTSVKREGFVADVDFTPDGKNIVVADRVTSLTELSLADLSEVASYPVSWGAKGVDIAPDGTVAGASYDRDNVGDIFVFPGGAAAPASVRDTSGWLEEEELAWSPDGTRLFAPVQRPGSSDFQLQIYSMPKAHLSTVTVKAPATASVLKALTVSGTVASTLPLPAGTPLTVTRYDVDAPQGKALGTKTLGANGAFSFTDTPTAGGGVTYKVAYAGDAAHNGASATAKVEVSRNKTALTLDRNGLTVNFNTPVWYTATLGPTYKNREVEIWADPIGPEPKKLLRRGAVNSEGKLAAQLKMTRDTWVSVNFAGDSRSAPAEARSAVYTRAGLTTTLSRHYKWTKIGSTSYQTYHQTADPMIAAWHNSYPGRSTRLDLQIWYGGAWQHVATDYFRLNANGMAYVTVDGDGAAGYRFRVRSAYVDGSSGDNVNTTIYGSWKYFNFTR